jgi:hypothetical protein
MSFFSRSDDDSRQGFALGFVHALIALVDSTVAGVSSSEAIKPFRRTVEQHQRQSAQRGCGIVMAQTGRRRGLVNSQGFVAKSIKSPWCIP